MTEEFESEVQDMCNLGKALVEQGIEQGLEQGIEQGRINQLIDLVMQNLLPIETAAQCAKMTLDEFKVAMDKNEN